MYSQLETQLSIRCRDSSGSVFFFGKIERHFCNNRNVAVDLSIIERLFDFRTWGTVIWTI